MASLKRNRGTWILILLLASGFFLMREKRSLGAPTALPPLVISVATPFSGPGGLDNGPFDSNLTVGIFEYCGDVTIGPAGSITCDEVGTPASACDINLVILGNLVIQAGGSIHADNVGNNGGNGGNITIDVGGPNFTLCGPNSTTAACGNFANPGAFISAQQAGGGNGQGGDILIRVGGVKTIPDPVSPTSPAIGVCDSPVICSVTIPLNTGDALIEDNATSTLSEAKIITDAQSGRAGNIALYTGRNIKVFGTVHAQGFQGAGHGGAITLDACCDLLIGDTGEVSSIGRDPGPDRVHLEACTVTVYGLVQSTGPAHQFPEPNCTPPERPDRPPNSTACVEIWAGTTLTISSELPHKAEVNADVGFSGGTSGRGWIDILANGDVHLNDGTGNDFFNPLIPGPQSNYLVHANMLGLTNSTGGLILVQSKSGLVDTFGDGVAGNGNALQANTDLVGGGLGGSVTVQAGGAGAGGNVNFNQASVQALGATSGGGHQGGGTIRGDANGSVTGGGVGSLDASGGPPLGSVRLFACVAVTYPVANTTPPWVPDPGLICPFVVVFPHPADTLLPAATCAQSCQPITFTPTPTPTNTPTSTTVTPTPTPTVPCIKSEVIGALAGHVPDKVVRLDLGESIQAAVTAAADTNGDGFVIVLVVKDGTGALGGHTNQRVTISRNDYGKPFQLFGCSVTMHDPNKTDGLPTGWITAAAGGANTIFIMDLHGADSEVAGWKVEGNGRTVRNTGGSGSPVGIWFAGNNNIMHNGAGSGNGIGLRIDGNGNLATDTDVFSNTSHGVQVIGNNNQLLKIDAGDLGKGNNGDGVNVNGTGNLIQENDAYANTLNGISATGGANTLNKNNGGARGKGNGHVGISVGGTGALTQNTAKGNTGHGFDVLTAGHTLKNNVSGGTGSGEPNGGSPPCQYSVTGNNTNSGGNKSNGVTIVPNPFPTGCH